jgi:dinuclear metal center YbgI/SA1388 family protein
MLIAQIIELVENYAPTAYQESYDNCGLLIGNKNETCKGVLCTLDVTEAVINEAIANNCNLIIAHHPIIFSGLKRLNGNTYVERTVIKAIKNQIAIYAIHTNLDNVHNGVSEAMGKRLGLQNIQVLLPKHNLLSKLMVFVPNSHLNQVQDAIFNAGAGHIGNYSECSFNSQGVGTYKPNKQANPYLGKQGLRHNEPETKIEVVFPSYLQTHILQAMKQVHPYEEVAYDIIELKNTHPLVGSGVIGYLKEPMKEHDFVKLIAKQFDLQAIKHTTFLNKPIQKVALCGGSGSFLIKTAIAQKADIFVSADIKYHEFFDAENEIIIADIGHFESEQFTSQLLVDILQQNFPTFAVLKSEVNTNPVQYWIA